MELNKSISASFIGDITSQLMNDNRGVDARTEIYDFLVKYILMLYKERGVTIFYCGGYSIFDYIVAVVISQLKKNNADIKLITITLSCYNKPDNICANIVGLSDYHITIRALKFDYRIIYEYLIENSTQLMMQSLLNGAYIDYLLARQKIIDV